MKDLPNPRKILIAIAVVFLMIGFFVVVNLLSSQLVDVPTDAYPTSTAIFPDGTEVVLEVADTQETQTLGLGQRDFLAKNSGMLFVYPPSDDLGFWMKGMRFPIDIIWLLDGEIVSISKDVQTEMIPLNIYRPEGLANQVIEVNAGFSDDHGLFSGDRVDIILNSR